MSMNKRRKRRRLVSDINVVPYIDVMLVLLVIFMVTAPLLNLGVDIELPKSNAKALENKESPILVSVARDGQMYLTLGSAPREAIDAETLKTKVAAFLRNNPKVPVLIGGDRAVEYGAIYEVMVLLQSAGAPRVGLMSAPAEVPPRR